MQFSNVHRIKGKTFGNDVENPLEGEFEHGVAAHRALSRIWNNRLAQEFKTDGTPRFRVSVVQTCRLCRRLFLARMQTVYKEPSPEVEPEVLACKNRKEHKA